MNLLILFILKLMDCSISTLKTVLLIKNKNLLSSLANSLSTFFYLMLIVHLTKNSSTLGIVVVCIATFIGTYLPTYLIDKLERDSVFLFTIIPTTNEQGKELADTLRNDSNIAVQTYKGYNNKEKVLCIKAFSESKKESILLEQLIPKDCTYHIVELKNYYSN